MVRTRIARTFAINPDDFAMVLPTKPPWLWKSVISENQSYVQSSKFRNATESPSSLPTGFRQALMLVRATVSGPVSGRMWEFLTPCMCRWGVPNAPLRRRLGVVCLGCVCTRGQPSEGL